MASAQPPQEGPIGSELIREDPSYTDIVVQFVDGLKDRLTTMESAIRAANFDALRVAAHQLKGSGGGYGYPVLTEQAATLEKLAKEHAIEQCTDALSELQEICSRVVVSSDSEA